MTETDSDQPRSVSRVNIEEELSQSYLDYAMSVIIGRALPDVRDGFKPVHRRVLYAMRVLGNEWNKSHLKSARIVGDVIGKYHPHGESAAYDTIVRMAQPFSMRYLLVDGQGNFGSVDGDPPAAMRYTEIRMSRIAAELMADIDKNTVDFSPNYDNSETMPDVLPSRVPNLLANGSAGIAVGMATNIPPHNLGELCEALLALQADPEIDGEQLLKIIPGPDFPTGGLINGRAGIVHAYRSGRGTIRIRARAEVTTIGNSNQEMIVVSELPYRVNKAHLLEQIAELVKTKRLEGITGLRDESDKDGTRMVIELRRGESGEVVLNNLFDKSRMQVSYGINMVVLDGGQPQLMNLKQLLEAFLAHRREVVTRRTLFLLRKARERAHLLEGLAVALANIDEVVAMIRSAATPREAKELLAEQRWPPGEVVLEIVQHVGADNCRPEELPANFGLQHRHTEADSAEQGAAKSTAEEQFYRLSPAQVQAILDLKLQRLTALEQTGIKDEYKIKIKEISEYIDILSNPDRLQEVISEELVAIRDEYADERRTEILTDELDLQDRDLIPDEPRAIILTQGGYAITQALEQYRIQRRGGIGRSAASVKEEDRVTQLLAASAHDTLLCFSNLGRVYHLEVFRIPRSGNYSRGRPLIKLLSLAEGEKIRLLLPLREFAASQFALMVTRNGKIKRTELQAFSRPWRVGLRALRLMPEDELIDTEIATEKDQLLLFSSAGRGIRFSLAEVRPMGRTAAGVRGIRVAPPNRVVSMVVPVPGQTVLFISANGYGKRSRVEDFPLRHRGSAGVIAMRCHQRTGDLLGAVGVDDADELMLISDQGTLIRVSAAEIPLLGRYTQGVRVVRLREGEHLVGISRVPSSLVEASGDDTENTAESPPSAAPTPEAAG